MTIILMFSAHFNISVKSGPILLKQIDFPLCCESDLPASLHTCLVNFDWILDIVSFTWLGAEYFCVPVTLLELCPGTQLCYRETV